MTYHNYIAQNYLDSISSWLNGDSISEFVVPDIRKSGPHDELTGVIRTLIDDTEEQMSRTKQNYDGLYDRYSTTSTTMNRLLSFQTASTSIQVNKAIKNLTIILILFAIMSGFGFFEWYQNHFDALALQTFFVFIVGLVWYIKTSS